VTDLAADVRPGDELSHRTQAAEITFEEMADRFATSNGSLMAAA